MREYTFKTWEAHCVGDWYQYKIKADSKKEAFKKLVEYFYAKDKGVMEEIESTSGTVSYPNHSEIGWWNMPRWFSRLISGYRKEKIYDLFGRSKIVDNYEELERFAKEHNINLRE